MMTIIKYARQLVLSIILASAASCGPLFPNSSTELQYFLLEDSLTAGENFTKAESSLVVRDCKANRVINSHKIIYSDDPRQLYFYQLAQWAEPPPKRFTALLLSRIGRNQAFKSSTHISSATLANFQLNTEMLEFYHDTAGSPGIAKVKVSAELIDLNDRSVVSHRTFSKSADVDQFSAKGAVIALNQATNEVIDEVIEWAANIASTSDI